MKKREKKAVYIALITPGGCKLKIKSFKDLPEWIRLKLVFHKPVYINLEKTVF